MGNGNVWGWFIFVRVWMGKLEVGIIFSVFFVCLFCFCAVANCSFIAGT